MRIFENKSYIYKGISSSCVWVGFWYMCFWILPRIPLLGLIILILCLIFQATILKTNKVKETILAWIISFFSSKILWVVVNILYGLIIKLFLFGYEDPSNAAGLIMILVTFMQLISEFLLLIIAIVSTAKIQKKHNL